MLINNEALIKEFISEGKAHIDKIESGLLELEKRTISIELINPIFRAAHSIKGTAGFFGLNKIVELSHSMEELLGSMRDGKLTPEAFPIDLLLVSTDKLKELFNDVYNSNSIDTTKVVSELERFSGVVKEDGLETQLSEKQEGLYSEANLIPVNIINNKTDLRVDNQSLILERVRRGHRIYKLFISLTNSEQSVSELKNTIRSIGDIFDSNSIPVDLLNDTMPKSEHAGTVIYFSSILEKELVAAALNLSEADIHQIQDIGKVLEKQSESGAMSSLCQHEQHSQTSCAPRYDFAKYGERRKSSSDDGRVRVDVALLDGLVDLAGEMVLGRNQLVRILENHVESIPGLQTALNSVNRLTTEIQERIMRTRLQPLANVFDKLPRIVRETSKAMNKSVEVVVIGKDVEVDKSVIEALADPLVQLVKNSLDHGIETPEVRQKFGKSSKATLTVKAYRKGGRVILDVSDDGAGINFNKVRQRALLRRIISREQAVNISEMEMLGLIFLPGFSTAKIVTDISGRGVGLDITKANIDKIGGTVEVFTALHKGTTFRLSVPLTLTIVPAFIVEASGHKFAMPQSCVLELVRLTASDRLSMFGVVKDRMVLTLRGELLPVSSLSYTLGLPLTENDIMRILIIRSGTKKFGLMVDIVHNQEEVLVKPLPQCIKGCKSYSGVTILGDGKVTAVLDPEGLVDVSYFNLDRERVSRDKEDNDINGGKDLDEETHFLVFSCYGTELFGISLAMISAIKEIGISDIETVGEKEYISLNGSIVWLVRIENFLPVKRIRDGKTKAYVILLKYMKQPIGILVEKINDSAQAIVRLDKDVIKARGILGSMVYSNRIISLINIYDLIDQADSEYFALSGTDKRVLRSVKVLLVVNDAFYAEMTQQYLAAGGYSVIIANDGEEALAILESNIVDVVVIDIDLPIKAATELAKEIRADNRITSIPIIGLISESNKELMSESLFDSLVDKLDRTELLGKLAAINSTEGESE